MIQKVLQDWNDLIIFLILIYIMLVFFGVLKYPNESWELKVEKLMKSRMGFWFKILLPLLVLGLLAKIILTIYE